MLSSQSWQKQSACRIKAKQRKLLEKNWIWNRQEAKNVRFEHGNSKFAMINWNWSMIVHNPKRKELKDFIELKMRKCENFLLYDKSCECQTIIHRSNCETKWNPSFSKISMRRTKKWKLKLMVNVSTVGLNRIKESIDMTLNWLSLSKTVKFHSKSTSRWRKHHWLGFLPDDSVTSRH